MRSLIIISSPLLCSSLLAACGDDAPKVEPTTITISSDKAPALVAFRDGLDADWQAATMKTATSYEAVVHGPYVVTVACEGAAELATTQIARTPDDEHAIAVSCEVAAPATHAITGHMAEAGRIQMGAAHATSTTAGWDFNMAVPNGTYDLMALNDDKIVLRRGIEVSGDLALTPEINLSQDGKLLAEVAFTAPNAAATETLVASVDLDKPGTPYSIYSGPIATVKAIPDTLLVAADPQTASVKASTAGGFRALRRPFRVGGKTEFTLPAPLTGVKWEQAEGKLALSWSAMPAFDSFVVGVTGEKNGKQQSQSLELSPRFVQETGIARTDVDTDIAGYKPEWKIDLAKEYSRELLVQKTSNGEVATISVSETVNAAQP